MAGEKVALKSDKASAGSTEKQINRKQNYRVILECIRDSQDNFSERGQAFAGAKHIRKDGFEFRDYKVGADGE
tara:strand:+ start:119 stop:337 length:219 start_codon:yes stop_codon:yes gene_type:complete